MARSLPKPVEGQDSVAVDLQSLGQLIRNRRAYSMLRIDDAAALIGVSKDTLSRLENGRPVGTDKLMSVIQGLGLTLFIMDKSLANVARRAIERDASAKDDI